jgi:hypothetical protein
MQYYDRCRQTDESKDAIWVNLTLETLILRAASGSAPSKPAKSAVDADDCPPFFPPDRCSAPINCPLAASHSSADFPATLHTSWPSAVHSSAAMAPPWGRSPAARRSSRHGAGSGSAPLPKDSDADADIRFQILMLPLLDPAQICPGPATHMAVTWPMRKAWKQCRRRSGPTHAPGLPLMS